MKYITLFFIFFFLTFNLQAENGQDSTQSDTNISDTNTKGSVYQARKFRDILNLIDKSYRKELDIDSLAEATFKAMLQSLDKFSHFYDKEELEAQNRTDEGKSVGMGFNYLTVDGFPIIYDVFPNSPAATQKTDGVTLKSGMKIIQIDTFRVEGNSLSGFTDLLEGEPGTKSEIIVKFLGELDTFHITREEYVSPSLELATTLSYEDKKGMYISLTRWSAETYDEVTIAIEKHFQTAAPDFIVWDVRGNLGGRLNAARDISDLYLDTGKVVTQTKSRDSRFDLTITTSQPPKYNGTPTIVLVDENSASASEIFAGVIQDYDLGLIVGAYTYGKGIVQNTWDFNDSTAVRFTVASYATPSGREVQPDRKFDPKSIDESIFFGMTEEQKQSLLKSMEQVGGTEKAKIYQSEKGRSIYELKGISPDLFLSNPEHTKMHQLLDRKKLYFIFGYVLIRDNKEYYTTLKSQGEESFLSTWLPSEKELSTFIALCKSNNLWNEEMYAEDKETILLNIKSAFAGILFNGATRKKMLEINSTWVKSLPKYIEESKKIIKGES
ncbi:MAG: hypothetical protein Kapaf2KO_08550 [Candidatus Kapaibacteriales bacterium]